jgi:hypothetical protein
MRALFFNVKGQSKMPCDVKSTKGTKGIKAGVMYGSKGQKGGPKGGGK